MVSLLKKPPSEQLAAGDPVLGAAVRRSRQLLHKRALVAAAAGAAPVPGLDWLVDAALLSRLIPQINAEFGLSPEQIARLDPERRQQVQKAITTVGAMLVGKVVTQGLVLRVAKTLGLRLTAQQAVKVVPLAGQAMSALIGYATVRHLGELHVQDCVRVSQVLAGRLPAPPIA